MKGELGEGDGGPGGGEGLLPGTLQVTLHLRLQEGTAGEE